MSQTLSKAAWISADELKEICSKKMHHMKLTHRTGSAKNNTTEQEFLQFNNTIISLQAER